MPSWMQNAPNEINRDPDSQRAGSHLPAYPVYAPEERQPDLGAPTRYTPFGIQAPAYDGGGAGAGGRALNAARWDGLGGRLMDVPQADFYNSEPNPWPANGVYDVPNGAIGAIGLLRLQPTTSAHPGKTMAPDYGPTMLFHAPPVFSMQTKPILAVGV
jgi:hypothetical protein